MCAIDALTSSATRQNISVRSSLGKGDQPIDQGKLEFVMQTDHPGILIVDDNEDNRYTLQLRRLARFWTTT
jgi:hypothetical protein